MRLLTPSAYNLYFIWNTQNCARNEKPYFENLRVVQTQAILFLKSMSERGGSDLERLWNWISTSTQSRLKMTLLKLRVVLCWIRLFPTLNQKIKWFGSGLPLNWLFLYQKSYFHQVYFQKRFWIIKLKWQQMLWNVTRVWLMKELIRSRMPSTRIKSRTKIFRKILRWART